LTFDLNSANSKWLQSQKSLSGEKISQIIGIRSPWSDGAHPSGIGTADWRTENRTQVENWHGDRPFETTFVKQNSKAVKLVVENFVVERLFPAVYAGGQTPPG
jgi:hypothetical protein